MPEWYGDQMRLRVLVALTIIAAVAGLPRAAQGDYTVGWIGNTFAGDRPVQRDLAGMHVAADGTVYGASARDVAIYRDGKVVGYCPDTSGVGIVAGTAITADDRYLYLALTLDYRAGTPTIAGPAHGKTWVGVSRRHRDGSHAPFPGGVGPHGDLLVIMQGTQGDALAGLARDAKHHLYVSVPSDNAIRVIDVETMTPVATWPMMHPGALTARPNGTLCVIQEAETADGSSRVVTLAPDGARGTPDIILPPDARPSGLAIDPATGHLLVACDGPMQQVLIYDAAGMLVSTLGRKGGLYGGVHGPTGDARFDGLAGVGADAAGNRYVGCYASGTVIKQFAPDGTLRWEIQHLLRDQTLDFDSSSGGTELFSTTGRFFLSPVPKSDGAWRWLGTTVDRYTFPDDPRLHLALVSASIRHYQGKRLLYATDDNGATVAVYRFNGDIAVPCALICPTPTPWPIGNTTKGALMWHDADGDGQMQPDEYTTRDDRLSLARSYIDRNGDIWWTAANGGLYLLPRQSVDENGVPRYAWDTLRPIAPPEPFRLVQRFVYFPGMGIAYVAGYTGLAPVAAVFGDTLARYDDWGGRRAMRWRVAMPRGARAMTAAYDRVFIAHDTADVTVLDADTGALLGVMRPGAVRGTSPEPVAQYNAINAYNMPDASYVVVVAERGHGRNIVYRIPGPPVAFTPPTTGLMYPCQLSRPSGMPPGMPPPGTPKATGQ